MKHIQLSTVEKGDPCLCAPAIVVYPGPSPALRFDRSSPLEPLATHSSPLTTCVARERHTGCIVNYEIVKCHSILVVIIGLTAIAFGLLISNCLRVILRVCEKEDEL
ncbi:hypothetical protein J6590_030094 [Homalodisca vitripennis]|nr:hypothetical protein J6590_030094 [Homalodisca vitripennis]